MDRKLLEAYQKELLKNKEDVDRTKKELIEQISLWDKEEIFERKKEKITLWMRIKRVLGF